MCCLCHVRSCVSCVFHVFHVLIKIKSTILIKLVFWIVGVLLFMTSSSRRVCLLLEVNRSVFSEDRSSAVNFQSEISLLVCMA